MSPFSTSLRWLRIAAVLLFAVSVLAEPGEQPEKQRGRRPKRQTTGQEQAGPAPQMVTPRFRYQHIRAGRRVFDIVAQKAETYADQDLLLTGVDEIKIYGADGKISKLRADFGRWHNKAGDFELWGNVQGTVKMDEKEIGEEVRFQSEKLVYKETWKAITTLRPVLLEANNITTTGVGLNYNFLTQEVVIGSEVVTTMQMDDPQAPAESVVITAGQLSLDTERKLAVYTKQPVLRLEKSQLSGERMEFFLAEHERRLEVEGQVAGSFHTESLGPKSRRAAATGQPPVDVTAQRAVFHAPSRTATFVGGVIVQRPGERLSCGRMVLLLNEKGHELESALAETNVEVIRPEGKAKGGRLSYRYATDEGLLSQNPQLILPEGKVTAQLIHFRRDGTILGERSVLLHHEPKGPAPTVDPDGSALDLQSGAPVDIAAERLTYAPTKGFVVFEEKVRVTRQGSRLESQKLTLNRNSAGAFQTLLAESMVKLVTEGRLLTGNTLHYDLTSRKALLQGEPAQARTADEFVTAKAMSFSGGSKDYSAREQVSIQLLAAPTDPSVKTKLAPKPISATCGRAHFAGSGRRVELAEEVHLNKPDEKMKLRSDEVDLFLAESRQISQLIARGGVQIQHAQGSAQGDLALYRSVQRELEISGKSVQILHQGRQSFPQRAVLHLDTQSVEFFGHQGLVRTILPVESPP